MARATRSADNAPTSDLEEEFSEPERFVHREPIERMAGCMGASCPDSRNRRGTDRHATCGGHSGMQTAETHPIRNPNQTESRIVRDEAACRDLSSADPPAPAQIDEITLAPVDGTVTHNGDRRREAPGHRGGGRGGSFVGLDSKSTRTSGTTATVAGVDSVGCLCVDTTCGIDPGVRNPRTTGDSIASVTSETVSLQNIPAARGADGVPVREESSCRASSDPKAQPVLHLDDMSGLPSAVLHALVPTERASVDSSADGSGPGLVVYLGLPRTASTRTDHRRDRPDGDSPRRDTVDVGEAPRPDVLRDPGDGPGLLPVDLQSGALGDGIQPSPGVRELPGQSASRDPISDSQSTHRLRHRRDLHQRTRWTGDVRRSVFSVLNWLRFRQLRRMPRTARRRRRRRSGTTWSSQSGADVGTEGGNLRTHFNDVMARVLSMPMAKPETFHLLSQLTNHFQEPRAQEDMDDLNFSDHMGHHTEEDERQNT